MMRMMRNFLCVAVAVFILAPVSMALAGDEGIGYYCDTPTKANQQLETTVLVPGVETSVSCDKNVPRRGVFGMITLVKSGTYSVKQNGWGKAIKMSHSQVEQAVATACCRLAGKAQKQISDTVGNGEVWWPARSHYKQ